MGLNIPLFSGYPLSPFPQLLTLLLLITALISILYIIFILGLKSVSQKRSFVTSTWKVPPFLKFWIETHAHGYVWFCPGILDVLSHIEFTLCRWDEFFNVCRPSRFIFPRQVSRLWSVRWSPGWVCHDPRTARDSCRYGSHINMARSVPQ